MATNTPNLLISFVSPSQNNKETTLNQGLTELDKALTNLLSLAMADADVTLTTGEGNQALANMVFVFTGANTAARTVTVPVNKKFYVVSNQTTGGFKITVKTPSGTGIDVLGTDGYVFCYCDGTNVIKAGGSGAGGGVGGVSLKSADYALVSGDLGKLIALSTGDHTFTVPNPPPSTSWFAFILNENPGVSPGLLTLARNSLLMNGVAGDIVLSQNEGLILFTDGTNYFYIAVSSGGGSSTLAGLADVSTSADANGDVLTYETASSRWKNKPGFANPMTTSGDIIYGGASGVPTRLAKSTDGKVLTLDSGLPSWQPAGGGGGGAAFQSLPRVTDIVADGSTTALAVVGDALNGSTHGTLAAVTATSTIGSVVEYPPAGGPGQMTLWGNPNHVTGRHCKLLFKGYFTTTGDDLLWIGLFSVVGNYGNNIGRAQTPGASGGVNYAAFRLANRSGSSIETTWHACTGDGASDTTTDTGVTQDTNEHTFAIVLDDDNSQVLFYIDGVLKATNTTTLPTAGTPTGWVLSAWYASAPITVGVGQIRVESDL